MFEWFTNLFQKTEDIQQMAEDGIKSAEDITNMIPGEADDQIVDAVAGKVEEVTGQFQNIKDNLPKSQ